VTWVQKERWHYWKGDTLVELRHLYIEYRPTETHQHFILPYEIVVPDAIAAMETDLREWDWIAKRSAPLNAPERETIVEQMREAVLVGGVSLEIVNTRPADHPSDPLSSLQALSDYMFRLANVLRDWGWHDAADEVFYSAMSYTWPITECLLDNHRTLRSLECREDPVLTNEALERLKGIIEGVALWLRR
jgi:hypothetical protein